MQRRTISFPDDVANAIEREAKRRRVPFSQVVREMAEKHLARPAGKHRFSFIGIAKGADPTISENVDSILKESWAASIAADSVSSDSDR